MSVLTKATFALLCPLALAQCNKIPLRDNQGYFSVGNLHWFENEKVAYVFFSLTEYEDRMVNPEWQLAWSETSESGGTIQHELAAIDFNAGVHQHRLVTCGKNTVCGSYSFRSDRPLSWASLRFLYDKDSPLDRQIDLAVSNHAAGPSADSYSALAYGVFDQANEHMQVRIHNNFGSPPHELYNSFGMTRRFRASQAVLADKTNDELAENAAAAATSLQFPAAFCTADTASGEPKEFAGSSSWLKVAFDPRTGARGACFRTEFLDQDGKPLLAAAVPAYGRRNPELGNANLTLQTPLRPMYRLPIVIRICSDDPFAGGMVADDFFVYQRFIMGYPNREPDICFRNGAESTFAQNLKQLLSERLTAAKLNNPESYDYIFTVTFHERFSREFREVHKIIAESLTEIVSGEASLVSPRLVAGFVYGTTADFQVGAAQRQSVLWCPQNLIPEALSPEAPLADENCTTTQALQLDLRFINFVAPLGPFPSLKQYDEYRKKYGDAGLAKNPDLQFLSVPNTQNTRVESAGESVTFFDSERYVIGPGESARVCLERLDASVGTFRLRTSEMPEQVPSLMLTDVNQLWLSDEAAGEYRIGMAWEYPFVGYVRYTSAVTGKVASIIPFQRSSRAYQAIGDDKWRRAQWDFGKFVQHCYRYCDNPYFDASGAYQSSTTWRAHDAASCPAPIYPAWDGGEQ